MFDERCTANGRICSCRRCGPTQQIEWTCVPNGQAEGCPPEQPRFGTPCDREALECNYSDCTGVYGEGPSARCLGGLWVRNTTLGCNEQMIMPVCP